MDDNDGEDWGAEIEQYVAGRDRPADILCQRCNKTLPRNQYKLGKNGNRNFSCFKCCASRTAGMKRIRDERAAEMMVQHVPAVPQERNADDSRESDDEEDEDENVGNRGTTTMLCTWQELLGFLKQVAKTENTCHWRVSVEDYDNLGEITEARHLDNAIALEIWEVSKYRWIYKDKRQWRGVETKATYRFYCAQNQKEVKRRKEDPLRARTPMDRFPCMGSMVIIIDSADLSRFTIRYKHTEEHEHFTDISIPQDAKDHIKAKKDKTPSELYADLKQQYLGRSMFFTQKQVYARWCLENEMVWKLRPEQLVSAGMILERMAGRGIERVPLVQEAGVEAFAFVMKDVLTERGTMIHEIGMDSTWKTNALGYELYAFVAEANGQALPLLFMFIQLDSTAETHEKRRALAQCLRYILPACPNIKFVLSDKDQSELNACADVLPPVVKHQLCYWHVLRYIGDRLAENTRPTRYDAGLASRTFPAFVDPTWGPAPPPPVAPVVTNPNDPNFQYVTLESAMAADRAARAARRPAVPFQFCPPQHRTRIVEMHRRIMCLHPTVPSPYHDGRQLTASEIHAWATQEMYHYCRLHHLEHVWAYMWNRWYTPDQWKLWARAAGIEVPRIRTTMMVESLWKVIKRKYLIDFRRPRLDLAIHLIITNALPGILIALERLSVPAEQPSPLTGKRFSAPNGYASASPMPNSKL
ncbi:hypothetical protein QFC22_006576 [Naganishia vaughanmartiniae]|uniref:Uncharacterized protein n=1 Tax=Naganishia vaughanmartiniae TaxID=1424756 RepID=A0ACC2WIM3_9TREE|nr:hypothetical protein QFC22_006576 [Naganishia vaughanmartiniae]